ncbi:chemotaxis protein [Paenibacillus cymbidii]|uniref:chemotaxis protein n=1 Tax=Paenibacillus cymbidii TaxID=1639034 RepID=UPI0010809311|nr:chemotaxis protein [Paenibacillus cymbidii]
MTNKVAVIVIHGLGSQKENFADNFIRLLADQYAAVSGVGDPLSHWAVKPVYWAQVLEENEDRFKYKLNPYFLRYNALRDIVIHYLADAVAYQPLETNNQIYRDVHGKISDALHELAGETGDNAPLCVVSHSLGTVIASNYFYDRQFSDGWQPAIHNPQSPLERGDTLTSFYSVGTTLPLWSMRYRDFDKPVHVPADAMRASDPNVYGEWINFYDPDDILGYPLRCIDDAYAAAVKEDIPVNVGGWLRNWNPLCHGGYLADRHVVARIAEGLHHTWQSIGRR